MGANNAIISRVEFAFFFLFGESVVLLFKFEAIVRDNVNYSWSQFVVCRETQSRYFWLQIISDRIDADSGRSTSFLI